MSEFSAKTIRAARKAKASRMGSADPHTKVDSSDWTPAEPLNADVKTGARPLSRRAFKSGGKVTGQKTKANMGRKPRCGGGKAGESWVNRNVKEANEDREGKKHVGGFKKGGRAGKQVGGSKSVLPQDPKAMAEMEASQKGQSAEQQANREAMRKSIQDAENRPPNPPERKRGGRTKKMDGGGMMPGAGIDPRMGMVSPNRMKFTGPQGSPYKKGGKVHSDEAMDKALIKKMVKPSARTGKAGGGMRSESTVAAKAQRGVMDASDDFNSFEAKHGNAFRAGDPRATEYADKAAKYGAAQQAYGRALDERGPLKKGGRAKHATGGMIEDSKKALMTKSDPHNQTKIKPAQPAPKEEAEAKKHGGRAHRATGGRTKGKGKTNINIIISTGKGQPQDGAPGLPPGLPGGPLSLQKPPVGMPPGMPPMPPGMPAGGPPGMGQPPMPPMARKSGGRVTKVASSYKDMEAGAASGEGRLQKTDIAKRIPKKKEDGVIETDKRGYPNKVIGATGGRTAHKAGGKVYRSYKDMDAGAGSGMGRLEKEEIQKRKH